DLRLGRIDDRLDEAVDGLALRFGDVGQGFVALELRAQFGVRQAEIARGGVEAAEQRPPFVEPEAGAAEQRDVAGLDSLLQLVALGLRQTAGRDGLVDAVLERLLQRSAERA